MYLSLGYFYQGYFELNILHTDIFTGYQIQYPYHTVVVLKLDPNMILS